MKNTRTKISLAVMIALGTVASGCAVVRAQQSVGSYVDDATISSSIRLRFAQSSVVSLNAIDVGTLKGIVQLSGFAKSQAEKNEADRIARAVNGVRDVRNDIIIRP